MININQEKANVILLKKMSDAIQKHLDNTAKTRNYDGILSLCSYAGSTNEKFNIEGTAAMAWRDQVWAYGEQVTIDVLTGSRTLPTIEELLAELPTIDW